MDSWVVDVPSCKYGIWRPIHAMEASTFALDPDPKGVAGTQIYLAETDHCWSVISYDWSYRAACVVH